MNKNPVIVIAEEKDRAAYDLLSMPGETVEFHVWEEFLKIMRHKATDLYLLDCGDQVERAISILNKIKILRNDIPVIFLNAAGSEDTVLAAFRAGAREYFRKPVNMIELEEKILFLLQLKRGAWTQKFLTMGKAGTVPILEGGADKVPDNLIRTILFMEEHLADSLDLDRFALEACLSKYHFSRTFKRFMGVTPMQHVTRRRVEWAKVLLRNADMNISSVAFKVGCCHFSDFTRQFKRITGMTPAAYKKSLASETKSVTSR